MIKKDVKKKLYSAVAVAMALIFVIAIYGSWNDMWYQFGQNVYHILHG